MPIKPLLCNSAVIAKIRITRNCQGAMKI